MPVIFTFDFGNLPDYFRGRRRVWDALEAVQREHRDRQYYVAWTMDYAANLITPTELLSHRDFIAQLRATSGKVGSNLISEMLSEDMDQSDSAFSLSICSCESAVANPQLRGIRADNGRYIRRGFMASVTNCILKGLWKQCLYYGYDGSKRERNFVDGLPKPEAELQLNRLQKEYRQRIAAFIKEYEEGAQRTGRDLVKDGINDRDLPRLAAITNTQITVWVQHAGSYLRRHVATPPTGDGNGRYYKSHFLLTRPDHAEVLLPDSASPEVVAELSGRVDLQYVSSERMLAIARKQDEETKEDVVFIIKGNPAVLTRPPPPGDCRLGNRHEDVVLQAGNLIYKHESLQGVVESRMGTHRANDHAEGMHKALGEANIWTIKEAVNRRTYRAVALADQVWGHKMRVPQEALDSDGQVYTYDFRKFYSTEFSTLPADSFPYFHGYPANPNFHEFAGPVGNYNDRCQPFTFGRGRFAVFRVYCISLEGMAPGLVDLLADAGLFQEEYGTYYVSSPVMHWLQDNGARWQADYLWVCYCTTDHWCPDQQLLEEMRETKTYGIVLGMLHSGRKPTKDSRAICNNRQDAVDLAYMYQQEFTNESAMRMNGFDMFFSGEEVVIDPELRRQAEEMVAAQERRRAQTERPTRRRRLVEGQSTLDAFMSGQQQQQQEEDTGPEHEVPASAAMLHPPTNSSTRPLSALKVLPMRVGEEGADPEEPHIAINSIYRYGERSDYGYIVCAQHGYCVTRMLQVLATVGEASCVAGYSLDAIHTTRDLTQELAAADLLREGEECGFFRPHTTRRASECASFSMGDSILSNHMVTHERLLEEVDPTLTPREDQPRYSEEADSLRQINIVTGRPGTGKTTGFFRRHQDSDRRLPPQTTVLATPTNLLAADFSNKFGCEAMTLHRATKYPVGSFPGPAGERFRTNAKEQKAGSNLWAGGAFRHITNTPKAQTLVVDEVTQHGYDITRDCIDVAKANHLQLVVCGDLCMESGRIYQMGPVEPMAMVHNGVQALQEESEGATHIRREQVFRQLGDPELQGVLDSLREGTDEQGMRLLQGLGWVRKISGKDWREEVALQRDLSITPLHRAISTITHDMLGRMGDDAPFKVQACAKMDLGDHRPEWFGRFMTEFGMDPAKGGEVLKGMTCTITKGEWSQLMDSPTHNQRYIRNSRPSRGVLVYNGRHYSWSQSFQPGPRGQAQVPCNKVNPLIVSTAHTVQGREVGEDGRVYIMYHSGMRGVGGWNEDFACNGVYVAASRIRQRAQLVLVDVADIVGAI